MNNPFRPTRLFTAAHIAIALPTLNWAVQSPAHAGMTALLIALLGIWGFFVGSLAAFLPPKLPTLLLAPLFAIADSYAMQYGLVGLSDLFGNSRGPIIFAGRVEELTSSWLGEGFLAAGWFSFIFIPALMVVWFIAVALLIRSRRTLVIYGSGGAI